MEIDYKFDNKSKTTILYTHFLYRHITKNHTSKISNFDQKEIDQKIVQNCIDELNSGETNTHSIKVLCDFILKNPIKIFSQIPVEKIKYFLDCIQIPEVQKEVLQCACFLIQLIPFNYKLQQLILRINFYSNIQRLIEAPILKEEHEIAMWCTVYSLTINEEFREFLFKKDIFNTLMNYSEKDINSSTEFSEYIRGKFFKTATSHCAEVGEILLDDIIRFLIQTIKMISSPNQSRRLFLCCGIDALRNTFKSSHFGLELIQSNNMIPIFISLLLDSEDEKIRRGAVEIIFELIQSIISNEHIINYNLLKTLFDTAQFNDVRLFHSSMDVVKFIFSDPDLYDLFNIIEFSEPFDFSIFSENCNFEIKIEMLSVLQLIIFHCNAQQISKKVLTEKNVEYLCDLINVGNCGVSADVLHVFTIAKAILDDQDFSDMIDNNITSSGLLEQLQMQMDDPENDKTDINHIEIFVRSLDKPEE